MCNHDGSAGNVPSAATCGLESSGLSSGEDTARFRVNPDGIGCRTLLPLLHRCAPIREDSPLYLPLSHPKCGFCNPDLPHCFDLTIEESLTSSTDPHYFRLKTGNSNLLHRSLLGTLGLPPAATPAIHSLFSVRFLNLPFSLHYSLPAPKCLLQSFQSGLHSCSNHEQLPRSCESLIPVGRT